MATPKSKTTAVTSQTSLQHEETLRPYELMAPIWLPTYTTSADDGSSWEHLHTSADSLGFPDLFIRSEEADKALIIQPSVIQQGHTRPPIVSNESASAHDPLGALLKQSTLTLLSNSILQILSLRHGSNSALKGPVVFKPPPRVMLTDAKREAWLHDLADDAVPLRKLSRTVPHGLRGGSLLDALLTRCIPYTRAIWFTRCVGANELRSLRRKGNTAASQAGDYTLQWTMEWTTTTFTWLTSILLTLPEQSSEKATDDWRERATYASTLCRKLYSEDLLNSSEWLRMIIDVVRKVELERFCCLYVLISAYWSELVKWRRTCTEAIVAILERGKAIYSKGLALPLQDTIQYIGELLNVCLSISPHTR